jgi:hypothetical protein
MSIACTICQAYHGHNTEEHFDYYESVLFHQREIIAYIANLIDDGTLTPIQKANLEALKAQAGIDNAQV